MGIAQLAARVLPYTVGDGSPVYRTNPSTGQRYTFAELTQKANQTTSEYQINNPYIQPDKPAIYA